MLQKFGKEKENLCGISRQFKTFMSAVSGIDLCRGIWSLF